MTQSCALCPAAAVVFCINDDAALCVSCDAAVHAGNPLLARHERRALACEVECASAAYAPSCSDDMAVVPQFQPAAGPSGRCGADEEEPAAAAMLAGPSAAPAASVAGLDDPGHDFAADLLDLDLPLLDFDFQELGERDFADCVVPGLETAAVVPSAPAVYGAPLAPAASPLLLRAAPADAAAPLAQPAMVPIPASMIYSAPPSGFDSFAVVPTVPAAPPSYAPPQALRRVPPAYAAAVAAYPGAVAGAAAVSVMGEDDEAREERLRRYRTQKRAKRNLGRAVRYQSRKAYAQIRPRIKGRFVSPEEWAAHLAQQAAGHHAAADSDASEALVPVF